MSSVRLLSSFACVAGSTSCSTSVDAAFTTSDPNSRRSCSLARTLSLLTSTWAAASSRAPSACAACLAASMVSVERRCACSSTCLARSRASPTMVSARWFASASSCCPFSPAAMPTAILRERSSIGPRLMGHTNFIVNQMSTMNTIICTNSVRLMFTVVSRPARLPPTFSVRQPGSERIREREEQRETDPDHGDCIDQRGDDEHLHLQHRRQLGLARGAFQKPAAKNTEADSRPECAHTEDDPDGQYGHGLDVCDVFHSTLLHKAAKKRCDGSLVMLLGHREIDHRQHHEYEGLQRNHKQMKDRPHQSEHELHQDKGPASEAMERC